jgi:hypothetical protein
MQDRPQFIRDSSHLGLLGPESDSNLGGAYDGD